MCLGRPADECCCEDDADEAAGKGRAVCVGCGRDWQVAFLFEEDGERLCPTCLAFGTDAERPEDVAVDDEQDDSSEHEAGCHCAACLDAIARHWQGEAERAMETVPDGEAY